MYGSDRLIVPDRRKVSCLMCPREGEAGGKKVLVSHHSNLRCVRMLTVLREYARWKSRKCAIQSHIIHKCVHVIPITLQSLAYMASYFCPRSVCVPRSVCAPRWCNTTSEREWKSKRVFWLEWHLQMAPMLTVV